MKAVVFHDVGDIRLEEVREPRIRERSDAIVRLTASAKVELEPPGVAS
jgi:threonine dehydrogenase-like Zn-dependent dehydrogenase